MDEIYSEIAGLVTRGVAFAICTIVETEGSVPRHIGSKMLVDADGRCTGTVGGGEVEEKAIKAAIHSIQTGQPVLIEYSLMAGDNLSAGLCGGKVKIYIEPVIQGEKIIIFGAGHVGKALAPLAKLLNFHVLVCDDREGSCNSSVFPDADEYFEMDMAKLPDMVSIDQRTYLVLVTRGADVDIEGIPALIETNAGYIGVMGSRRRWDATEKGLIEKGVHSEALVRIKHPIGLDIKAETPEEIAVSIMAEIIQLKYSRTPPSKT